MRPPEAAAEPPDFVTRVQPKLVKAGCFSGACHGAGAGKAGFKLSLLGYDPELDYEAIVYQYRGRRVNPVRPEESLVVRKRRGALFLALRQYLIKEDKLVVRHESPLPPSDAVRTLVTLLVHRAT